MREVEGEGLSAPREGRGTGPQFQKEYYDLTCRLVLLNKPRLSYIQATAAKDGCAACACVRVLVCLCVCVSVCLSVCLSVWRLCLSVCLETLYCQVRSQWSESTQLVKYGRNGSRQHMASGHHHHHPQQHHPHPHGCKRADLRSCRMGVGEFKYADPHSRVRETEESKSH